MTHHNLYLQSNRHFAARAALISVAKSDRRTEDTFLIYLLNISTLVHFAEGALGFIAMHVAKRVLNKATDMTVDATWAAAKKVAAALSERFRRQSKASPLNGDVKQLDELNREADQVVPPLLQHSAELADQERENALSAGRTAAVRYLQEELGFPEEEARDIARLMATDLRQAITQGLPLARP